jgi:hypothetical protein
MVSPRLHGQSCLADSKLSTAQIGSLPPSSDGLIHVKVGFTDSTGTVITPSQSLQDTLKNSATDWNAGSPTTGVQFDVAKPGDTVNVPIELSSDQSATGGCIAINPTTGKMAYSSDWTQLASNDPKTAQGSIDHELGHYVGLADAGVHPSPATIMNNPDPSSPCSKAKVDDTDVKFTDDQAAAGCTKRSQALQSGSSGGGGGGGGCPDCLLCPPNSPDCPSPIIIDTEGEGFHLTSAENGVRFDIRNDGHLPQIAWTDPRFHNAFLVLDRNGDGIINNGSELFGNFTIQDKSSHANGFLALAEFDEPDQGGNGDGVIDERDAIFSKLRLWIDENHDGISQPNELHALPELGIFSLSTDYTESSKKDQFGNQFRFKARVNPRNHDQRDGISSDGRWAYDVFFVSK